MRYVSLASMGAAVSIAAGAWILYGGEETLRPVTLTLLALLTIWRHKTNIQRLLKGTENRFSKKKKDEQGQNHAN
jgi:glycerol-3-phosphate acyltransferase PlsY